MSSNGGGGGGGGSGTGQRTRCQEFLSSVPLVTLLLFATCVAVYIIQNLGDFNAAIWACSISGASVVYRMEWYRIITAAFTHGGLLHIAMNMMTLLQLGGGLEPMFGSIQYFFVILIMVLTIGGLYVGLAFLAGVVYPVYILQPAVGFSGVLFAMAVDEATLSPLPTRSVFGLFSVPTVIYPWVLMVLLQLVLPGVSFMGHLAGVIIGFLYAWGAFRWITPSLSTCRKIEEWPCMRGIVRLAPYKLTPSNEVLRESRATSCMSQVTHACSFLACLCKPVTDCMGPTLARWRARMNSRSGAAGINTTAIPASTSQAGAVHAATAPRTSLSSLLGGTRSAGGYERVQDVESGDGDDGSGSGVSDDLEPGTGSAGGGAEERAERARRLLAAAKARAAAAASSGRDGSEVSPGRVPVTSAPHLPIAAAATRPPDSNGGDGGGSSDAPAPVSSPLSPAERAERAQAMMEAAKARATRAARIGMPSASGSDGPGSSTLEEKRPSSGH